MYNFFACPYCSLKKELLNRPIRWDCGFEVRDFHLIDGVPVLPAIFFSRCPDSFETCFRCVLFICREYSLRKPSSPVLEGAA